MNDQAVFKDTTYTESGTVVNLSDVFNDRQEITIEQFNEFFGYITNNTPRKSSTKKMPKYVIPVIVVVVLLILLGVYFVLTKKK